MKLKSLFLLVSLLSLSQAANSQAANLRATQFANNVKFQNEWLGWSDWKDCNILGVFNLDKGNFKIYSSKEQTYNIISSYPTKELKDGSKEFKFLCVDNEGQKCNVRYKLVKNNDFAAQLYIEFPEKMLVYNIKTTW